MAIPNQIIQKKGTVHIIVCALCPLVRVKTHWGQLEGPPPYTIVLLFIDMAAMTSVIVTIWEVLAVQTAYCPIERATRSISTCYLRSHSWKPRTTTCNH